MPILRDLDALALGLGPEGVAINRPRRIGVAGVPCALKKRRAGGGISLGVRAKREAHHACAADVSVIQGGLLEPRRRRR